MSLSRIRRSYYLLQHDSNFGYDQFIFMLCWISTFPESRFASSATATWAFNMFQQAYPSSCWSRSPLFLLHSNCLPSHRANLRHQSIFTGKYSLKKHLQTYSGRFIYRALSNFLKHMAKACLYMFAQRGTLSATHGKVQDVTYKPAYFTPVGRTYSFLQITAKNWEKLLCWRAFFSSEVDPQPKVLSGSGSCFQHRKISGLHFYLAFPKSMDARWMECKQVGSVQMTFVDVRVIFFAKQIT